MSLTKLWQAGQHRLRNKRSPVWQFNQMLKIALAGALGKQNSDEVKLNADFDEIFIKSYFKVLTICLGMILEHAFALGWAVMAIKQTKNGFHDHVCCRG